MKKLNPLNLALILLLLATPSVHADAILTLSQNSATVDIHTTPTIALFVDENESPSPFISNTSPYVFTFTANLNIPIRDRFTFQFQGRGHFTLVINNETVLDFNSTDPSYDSPNPTKPLRLSKGPNVLRATYIPPPTGPARARLLWSSTEFPLESIPPTALSIPDQSRLSLATFNQLRLGRQTFAQYRCAFCHADPTFLNPAAMPELLAPAPILIALAQRINPTWIAQKILNPSVTHSAATMPKLLHSPSSNQDAADIAAYLTSLPGFPLPADLITPVDNPAAIKRGSTLYATLGCVACHTLSSSAALSNRLPLNHLAQKFKPNALAAYLQNPAQLYPTNPMPNFNLTGAEATSLAAFLISNSDPPTNTQPPAADPKRGAALAAQLGCASCHALPIANNLTPPTLAKLIDSPLNTACLSSNPAPTSSAPHFNLTADQRRAIAALIKTAPHALAQDTPTDFTSRQLTQLNCAACHPYNNQTPAWQTHAAEVADFLPPKDPDAPAVLDQRIPDLTRIGAKLLAPWMQQTIAGALPAKPRPWLTARMPAFPAHAQKLAHGLAANFGLNPSPQPLPTPNPDLAPLGQTLTRKTTGFGCTDCHAIASLPAQAVFEAQGLNLNLTSKRLQPDYFKRWMLNPIRYDRQTKMPVYADQDGYTPLAQHLQGEAIQQYNAIWQYLLAGEKLQPPPAP